MPPDYLTLYTQAAAACPGLDWSVLAAIGKIESDHGRSTLPGVHSGSNYAGAAGPMQFLPTTFTAVIIRHPLPPGGAVPLSLYNPHDAIYAAAFELCDNGARDGHDLRSAIFAYNHADWYVDQVLKQAVQYSEPTPNTSAECSTVQSTVQPGTEDFSSAALTAVAFACAQIGKPYMWGGNGDPGFDCSGLTHAAYAAAGIQIPRTAQTQYDAGPLLPATAPLQPGDLVFFGTPNNVHHVGISLGGTVMVDAPDVGRSVTVRDFRGFPDYAGASRPAY
ncbi:MULTISPECIES: bifunctional lytic transglycosylase/C40 family peptidase [Protofrankia]|uniref:C40 family peptidase n=1 Tax=Protofrankia TaxID=2994361 RepID=UPI001F34C259|nr:MULTISPECIES: bifunctional lytic transglycosylase/C40 family peptidase [Protofrankia]